MNQLKLAASLVIAVGCCQCAALASDTQVIYRSTTTAEQPRVQSKTVTQRRQVTTNGVPMQSSTYIEHSAAANPSTTAYKIAENPNDRRSNYQKRLADLLEQIETGRQHGWLNAQQYQELKNWQANCATEVNALKDSDGGKVTRNDADELERHLNGLAYMINRDISQNSNSITNSAK